MTLIKIFFVWLRGLGFDTKYQFNQKFDLDELEYRLNYRKGVSKIGEESNLNVCGKNMRIVLY